MVGYDNIRRYIGVVRRILRGRVFVLFMDSIGKPGLNLGCNVDAIDLVPGVGRSDRVEEKTRQGLRPLAGFDGINGGRYWTRTSDPYNVSVVRYQLR